MKETYTKLLNEFIEIYSSEPNKLIDHQLGELTCTISEDFCNQFTNYCSEKGVDTERDDMDEVLNGEFDISDIFICEIQ